MSEDKACPFCDGAFIRADDLVACGNHLCGIGHLWMTEEQWNRRSAPVAQQADRIASLEKQNADLLLALREFADAAHLVLIAGGDYGDELSDRCLRDLLKEHRDKARALASCTPTATEAAAPKEPT